MIQTGGSGSVKIVPMISKFSNISTFSTLLCHSHTDLCLSQTRYLRCTAGSKCEVECDDSSDPEGKWKEITCKKTGSWRPAIKGKDGYKDACPKKCNELLNPEGGKWVCNPPCSER